MQFLFWDNKREYPKSFTSMIIFATPPEMNQDGIWHFTEWATKQVGNK